MYLLDRITHQRRITVVLHVLVTALHRRDTGKAETLRVWPRSAVRRVGAHARGSRDCLWRGRETYCGKSFRRVYRRNDTSSRGLARLRDTNWRDRRGGMVRLGGVNLSSSLCWDGKA